MRAAFRLGIALLVFGGTCCEAGAAQVLKPELQTGSRIPVKPKQVTGRERRALLKDFASCVFRSQPDRVDYFLRHSDMTDFDPGLGNIVGYLRLDKCLGAQEVGITQMGAEFSTHALRGLLAEQAYLDNRKAQPENGVEQSVPRPSYAKAADVSRAQALGAFADCVVAQNSADADNLMRTGWGTVEEKQAAKALVPTLGACLPQGETISLRIEDVRGFVADGLWQRFEAPMPVTYEGKP
ncbi:hypothetical protein [Novosphingobium pentaromativorans]|uniref:hypothetical protein n=1 Tax=Novosphingobium pentaromativorans TaxID=205844 RepID=UPI0005872F2D|nr:hypothetical protein [Novosphingobium pentaromativorans]